MNAVKGVTWHHTASPAASVVGRNNPTTQYMTSGLGYPLANYGLAWDGSLDVIAAGTGAHAGKGSYRGIPNNDGNRHMIGVEVEGTIGLEWSAAQLEAAARLGAQLNKDFGTDLLHIAHYEWAPGRKTDPTGIPGNMPALRAAIKRGHWATIKHAAPTATPKEDTLSAAEKNEIIAEIRAAEGRVKAHLDNSLTVQADGLKASLLNPATIAAAVWDHTVQYRDHSRNESRDLPAKTALYNISWGNAKALDALTVKEG